MISIFLKKSYPKSGEETNPRLFSKIPKLSISLDQQSETLYSLFLWYIQVWYKLWCWLLAFISYKVFWKAKRGLELISLPQFLHFFEEKYFLCYIPLTDQILLSDCFYFLKYWTICVLQLFTPPWWRHKRHNVWN